MTSGRDASRDTFDQRLAEARDSILFDGENIVAQEMGDQGQAIVLTQSRILIIKAGLAATGEMNGQKTATYVFDEIESVKLRKGPMGAVIHVSTNIPQTTTPGSPPMNLVVFGDPQKVKRSEAFVAQIEAVMGKPVERIEPAGSAPVEASVEMAVQVDGSPVDDAVIDTPVVDLDAELEQIEESEAKPKKGGREAKSLADEMFAEMSAWTPPVAPVQPETPVTEPAAVEPPEVKQAEKPWEDEWTISDLGANHVQDSIIESIPEATVDEVAIQAPEAVVHEAAVEEPGVSETVEDFRPNPHLPRPVNKQKSKSGVMLLIGTLGVLVLAGLAIMAPLKNVQTVTPTVDIDVNALTHDTKLLQSQVESVIEYRAEVDTLLVSSNASSAGIQSALRSGNTQSAISAARSDASSKALAGFKALKTPAGLAAAQEDVVSGLFSRKNGAAAVANSMLDSGDALRKFSEADRLIRRGLVAIDSMQQQLEKQITEQNAEKEKE